MKKPVHVNVNSTTKLLLLLQCIIFTTGTVSKQENICLTADCMKTASNMLTNMDLNVDPCDDFYAFSCGNYEKHTPFLKKTYVTDIEILNDKVQQQLISLLEEPHQSGDLKVFLKLKDYYKSCKDFDAYGKINLNGVKQFMKSFGGWPVIEHDWNENTFDWVEFASIAMKKHYPTLLWFLTAYASEENKNATILKFQNSLYVYMSKYNYLNMETYDGYYKPVAKFAKLMGANETTVENDVKDAIKFIKDVVHECEYNNYEEPNNITLAELQSTLPSIQWLKFINYMLESSDKKHELQDTIYVKKYDCIKKLENVLKNTPKRVVANSLFFELISGILEVFPEEELIKILLDGVKVVPYDMHESWKEKCFKSIVHTVFLVPMYHLYRKKIEENVDVQNIEAVFNNTRFHLKEIIRGIHWMDGESKTKTLERIDAATIIDFSHDIIDEKEIVAAYEGLEVDRDDFLGSSINVTKYLYELDSNKQLEVRSWAERLKLNKFSDEQTSLPGSGEALLKQLHNKDRPSGVNYGFIGTRAATLLAKKVIIVPWFQNENDTNTFLDNSQCIVDKYQKFTVPQINKELLVPPYQQILILTNMYGVKAAYDAFKKLTKEIQTHEYLPGFNLTSNQMFWLSAAQLRCEKRALEAYQLLLTNENGFFGQKFIVTGAFSNIPEFSKDFNCPVGSNMNPVKQCFT